jgi:hypothetical protein
MPWQHPIIEVRQAHLRATLAEHSGHWHVVAQHYHFCFDQAAEARDDRALRFFASKLAVAYRHMGMPEKSTYYHQFG